MSQKQYISKNYRRCTPQSYREILSCLCRHHYHLFPNKETHLKHIEHILQSSEMLEHQCQLKFFKTDVQILGFFISEKGIRTCVDKVHDIMTPINYAFIPWSVPLFLTFCEILSPNSQTSNSFSSRWKRKSTKTSKLKKINLDEEAQCAFEKIKHILASEQV